MSNKKLPSNWQDWPILQKQAFLTELKKIDNPDVDYSKYKNDPVEFCTKELGYTYTDDIEKLMLSVRDNKITIAISATGTGKTHACASISAWFYKCIKGRVYTAAAPPIENLKMLIWGEISALYSKNTELFGGDEYTYLNISNKNDGASIIGLTIPSTGGEYQKEAKFSGKHYPWQLFCFDEGDAVPDSVYSGADGCLSGGFGRMLIMFNPKEESGSVYQMIESGCANVVHLSAFNHPNVITGQDIYPGAVTRDKTIERINELCRPLVDKEIPDNKCFELPDFLVGETTEKTNVEFYPPLTAGWYKIEISAFCYKVLGEYPFAGDNQLIAKEWIDKARVRWDIYVSQNGEIPPIGVPGIMGQDVAEFGDDSNVSCFRYSGFVEQFEQWSGVDTIITGEKAAIEYRKRNLLYCNVDSTGVGSSVAPTMNNEDCKANRIMVAFKPTYKIDLGEFGIMRDQIAWGLRNWLMTDNTAMLPPNVKLLEEMRIVTYEIKNGLIKIMPKEIMKKHLGRSPDFFDALCLTFAPDNPKTTITVI